MDHDTFIQAVVADPQDNTPRLIFADWLDETGESERATFIRLQCEAADAAATGDTESAEQLTAVAEELLEQHHARWLGPLDDSLMYDQPYGPFQRGLLEHASVDAQTLVEHQEAFFRLGPVSSLEIKHVGKQMRTIAEFPQLARVRFLLLNDAGLGDEEVEALVASPFVQQVRALALADNPCASAAAEAIANSPNLPALEVLRLDGTKLAWEGIAALAASPYLDKLHSLNLARLEVDRRRKGAKQIAKRFADVAFE